MTSPKECETNTLNILTVWPNVSKQKYLVVNLGKYNKTVI